MVITVIEDPKYTGTYGFNMTVTLNCVRSSSSGHELMEAKDSKFIQYKMRRVDLTANETTIHQSRQP